MKKELFKDYSFRDKQTHSNDWILYSHFFQRLCTYEKWSKTTIFNLYYFFSLNQKGCCSQEKKRIFKLKDFLQSEPN